MSVLGVLCLLTDGPGGHGGIARFNTDWLTALGAIPDIRLDVVAQKADPAAVHALGVERLWLGATRAGYLAALAVAGRSRRRFDWICCGHLHFAPLARFLARRTGARVWLQLHGIDAWTCPGAWRRRAADTVDLAVAVSRYTRERFLAWSRLAPERVRVLPNTVAERFTPGPPDPELRARWGTEKVLLAVGRLAAAERYKGHECLIELIVRARAAGRPWRLVVVGDGDDRPRLEAFAVRQGAAPWVEFTGQLSEAALIAHYRSADLFVLPSSGEGFGIVYLEAMACGLPALGRLGDGSADPLADGELGWLAAPERLQETVAEALSAAREPHLLAERVRRRFGFPAYARHVARLLAVGLA